MLKSVYNNSDVECVINSHSSGKPVEHWLIMYSMDSFYKQPHSVVSPMWRSVPKLWIEAKLRPVYIVHRIIHVQNFMCLCHVNYMGEWYILNRSLLKIHYLFHFSYFLCFSAFGSLNYRRIICVKTVLVNLADTALVWSQTWRCLSKGNMCIHKTVHHMWPFNTEIAFPLGRDGIEHDNNNVFLYLMYILLHM